MRQGLARSLTPKPANTKVLNSINGNMKESTNWYWTPDLKIIRHVAQLNGISQVCECSDVAYLEAEKERLEAKRQEWVDGARKATNTIRAVYFEELVKEVDYQLEYVEQHLSELREPAELLGGMDDSTEIPPSKMPDSEKLLGGMDDSTEIPPSKMPDSEKLLGGMDEEAEIPPSKNPPSRRRKGQGTGYIYWRTVKRGSKTYRQAYYHYEVYQEGDRLIKSSKYIPKGKLAQVQQLDNDKVPLREILKLLGGMREIDMVK